MFLFGKNSSAFFKPAPGWFDFGSRDTSSRWHRKPYDWRGSGEWKMQSRSCHVNIYVVIVVLILIDNRVFEKKKSYRFSLLKLTWPRCSSKVNFQNICWFFKVSIITAWSVGQEYLLRANTSKENSPVTFSCLFCLAMGEVNKSLKSRPGVRLQALPRCGASGTATSGGQPALWPLDFTPSLQPIMVVMSQISRNWCVVWLKMICLFLGSSLFFPMRSLPYIEHRWFVLFHCRHCCSFIRPVSILDCDRLYMFDSTRNMTTNALECSIAI